MSNHQENWKTGRIYLEPCQLEYKVQDHPGLPWMVFLHGFGQDYRAFDEVYKAMEGHFSFLSIHVFFHGESILEGNDPLRPSEWIAVLEALFAKLDIQNARWMAYSMGAKFALVTYQYKPEWFESLILLAPDGIVMSPWYQFAARTVPGRLVLKICLKWMPFFHLLVHFFTNIGLIRSGIGRFASHQLSHPEGRELVLNVWLRFRRIWPKEEVWIKHFRSRPIPFMIALGKYDSIIAKSNFVEKRQNWKGVTWAEFDAGHASLVDRFASKMRL